MTNEEFVKEVETALEHVNTSVLAKEDKEELEKDKEEIKKEVKEFSDELEEKAKSQIEAETQYRNMMEEALLKKAEETDNEEEKNKLIGISKAYTDGYQLTPLIDFINDWEFNHMYDRYKSSRFNVISTDFDAQIQKIESAHKTRHLEKLRLLMMKTKNFNFENDEINKFCVALGLYARYKVTDDNYGVWFLYNAYNNVVHLCSIKKPASLFDRDRVKFFIKFFDSISK